MPGAHAQSVTATVTTGTGPASVAVNSVTNKVYVANQVSNTVTVIDGATNKTSTVATGLRPIAVAVDSVTNKIYVANWNSNNVTVIDGATNSTTTVAAGLNPFALAVNPVTDTIYVANRSGGSITVINGATNATSTVAAGSAPYALAVNAVTNTVYVADINNNDVIVINGVNDSTSTVAVGSAPDAVVVSAVTNQIYVANLNGNSVTVINGANNSTSTVAAGTAPYAMDINTITNKIYVANKISNNVTVIDGATNSTATVPVSTTPLSLAVNATASEVYVVNANGNSVTEIDSANNTDDAEAVGTTPVSVAANPVTGAIYVANYNSNSVSVLASSGTAGTNGSAAIAAQQSFALSATPAIAASALPTAYFAYGDSITYGSGASSNATRYASLIAADLNAVLTDRGVGGAEACDTSQVIMSNDNPPATLAPLQTIEIGTNDAFIKGLGSYEPVYKSCHTASLAWLAIPSSQKTAAQSCTPTGTWSPDTTYIPGLAAMSSTVGAALSCPVTSYGGPVYLWYRVTDGNIGSFTYSVDGGQPQSVNSFSNPTISTWNGGTSGVFLIRLPGLAAGSHTVVVTVTAPTVSILAVGSFNPLQLFGAPQVFAGGVIQNQYGYNDNVSGEYDSDAAADVALLSGDGLPVYFVPVRSFVNADSDMYDGFHPDDAGHLHIRDAYESLTQFPLNALGSLSSLVSVVPANGFNSPVTLAASGWPAGITGTFQTNPVTSSSTVIINVPAGLAPGAYTLPVNGTSGALSAATTIPVTVAAPASFSVSATAATAAAGSPATSTLTVRPANGFHSLVEFSTPNWPTGITAAFSANPAISTSVATITVAASVMPGLYSLPLNGTFGTLTASTTLYLTVTAPQGLPSSAIFTGTDSSTQGAWTSTYGADGYIIANGASSLPAYASVAFSLESPYTWVTDSTDVRALQNSPGSKVGIASCYCSTVRTFNINLNLTDGKYHQIALYQLDWDTTLRSQTITITDTASGILLDTRSFSQFNSGVYGVWNIKGNVTINVTSEAPGTAVASGIFFGPVVASAPAPQISSVLVSNVTGTTATVTWTTDEPSSSQVNYGVNTAAAYTASSTPSTALVTAHSVTLSGLAPGTTYYFDVVSANFKANSSASPAASFTTTGVQNEPAITNVSASSVTGGSAIITWTTDQPSSSTVNFGTTSSYGFATTLPALVTNHSVMLTGLIPNTPYFFEVASTNAANSTTASSSLTFQTTANTATPPVPAYLAFWNITSSGVTISWATTEPATTAVLYGTTSALGQLTPVQTALTNDHGVTLTGLTPSTTYYFVVESADAAGNTGVSTTYSFTTLVGPPTLSGITPSPSTSNQATINWTTSVPTYSYVQYGTAAGTYVRYSTLTGLTTTPQCVLPYVPSGTVHYQLVSTNVDGVQVISPDMTFVEP